MTNPLRQLSGRENVLKRYHPPDDPVVLAAVAARKFAHAEQAIRRESETLTAEQRAQLAIVLLTVPERPATS